MDHKQLMLHELLQQDQEPFHLKSYISDKRSQLHSSSPPTHLKRRASLHIPSRTAAVLAEAALKIQKQRRRRQIKSVGLCFFDSFFKVLKIQSKNRVLKEKEVSEEIGISCSCKRLSRDDLRASTSTDRPELCHEIGDFELREARFCSSPFRFCLHKSPSSPATSPIRRVKQEKENNAGGQELQSVSGVEEEKEQFCSPVSVLDDNFFEDEDEEEEDDGDLERSYANIERARQQLLDRLRRFEKLAALDPLDLEQKFLEASDEECQEGEDAIIIKRGLDINVISSTPMKMMKRLVCDDVVPVLGGTLHYLLRAADRPIEVVPVVMVDLDIDKSEEETAAQVEQAIFEGLIEELSDELFCINV